MLREHTQHKSNSAQGPTYRGYLVPGGSYNNKNLSQTNRRLEPKKILFIHNIRFIRRMILELWKSQYIASQWTGLDNWAIENIEIISKIWHFVYKIFVNEITITIQCFHNLKTYIFDDTHFKYWVRISSTKKVGIPTLRNDWVSKYWTEREKYCNSIIQHII